MGLTQYYTATSLDGFIADPDQSLEWLFARRQDRDGPLNYGPDTLANYEAGIKSQWLDNRLRLNLSAFIMKWDDIQIHFDSTDAYWIEGNINGSVTAVIWRNGPAPSMVAAS